MTWKYKDEEDLEVTLEEDKEVLPLEAGTVTGRTGYVAVMGITFDKHNGVRIEAGEDVPPEFLEDDFVFNWLSGKRNAIKLK